MVTQAVGCAHVIGVNLPPRQWAPLAAELVAAEQQSAARRTAALVVLAALLHAAAKAGVEADGGCVQLVASTLCSPQLGEAAAAADGGPLQQQLLAACFNLLQWAGPAVTPVAPQLFQLLLRLWAIEAAAALDAAAEATARASAAADALTAAAVLDRLAAAVGQGSAADLCAQYGPALLSRCLQVSLGSERNAACKRSVACSLGSAAG